MDCVASAPSASRDTPCKRHHTSALTSSSGLRPGRYTVSSASVGARHLAAGDAPVIAVEIHQRQRQHDQRFQAPGAAIARRKRPAQRSSSRCQCQPAVDVQRLHARSSASKCASRIELSSPPLNRTATVDFKVGSLALTVASICFKTARRRDSPRQLDDEPYCTSAGVTACRGMCLASGGEPAGHASSRLQPQPASRAWPSRAVRLHLFASRRNTTLRDPIEADRATGRGTPRHIGGWREGRNRISRDRKTPSFRPFGPETTSSLNTHGKPARATCRAGARAIAAGKAAPCACLEAGRQGYLPRNSAHRTLGAKAGSGRSRPIYLLGPQWPCDERTESWRTQDLY